MATEEFKLLTKQLFSDYVSLLDDITKQGHSVNLSFKEYTELYIKYIQVDDYEDDDEQDEEELEELED